MCNGHTRTSSRLLRAFTFSFLILGCFTNLNNSVFAAEDAPSCASDIKTTGQKREPLVSSVSEIIKMPLSRRIQLFDRAVHIANPKACSIQSIVNAEIGTRSGVWNLSCGESRLPPDYAVMILGTSRQKLRVLCCSPRQPVGFGCATILE